jgi:Amt family ammonium transporter
VPYVTLLGTGMFWFGWFGFNAGSALAANGTAAMAFLTTNTASAAAMMGWMLLERLHRGKIDRPRRGDRRHDRGPRRRSPRPAGHVGPMSARLLGALAFVCYAAMLKHKLGYDDFDAFGVHGVGFLLGALMTGLLCFTPPTGLDQFLKQLLGAAVAIGFSGGMTLLLGLALRALGGLRVNEEAEQHGLDLVIHGERSYHPHEA